MAELGNTVDVEDLVKTIKGNSSIFIFYSSSRITFPNLEHSFLS